MRSNDISREEIRRKLNPAEFCGERLREGVNREGFCKTRKTFDKKVVTGEEANKHAVDKMVLPNQDAGNFLTERFDEGGAAFNFSGKFFRSHVSSLKKSEWIRRKVAPSSKRATAHCRECSKN